MWGLPMPVRYVGILVLLVVALASCSLPKEEPADDLLVPQNPIDQEKPTDPTPNKPQPDQPVTPEPKKPEQNPEEPTPVDPKPEPQPEEPKPDEPQPPVVKKDVYRIMCTTAGGIRSFNSNSPDNEESPVLKILDVSQAQKEKRKVDEIVDRLSFAKDVLPLSSNGRSARVLFIGRRFSDNASHEKLYHATADLVAGRGEAVETPALPQMPNNMNFATKLPILRYGRFLQNTVLIQTATKRYTFFGSELQKLGTLDTPNFAFNPRVTVDGKWLTFDSYAESEQALRPLVYEIISNDRGFSFQALKLPVSGKDSQFSIQNLRGNEWAWLKDPSVGATQIVFWDQSTNRVKSAAVEAKANSPTSLSLVNYAGQNQVMVGIELVEQTGTSVIVKKAELQLFDASGFLTQVIPYPRAVIRFIESGKTITRDVLFFGAMATGPDRFLTNFISAYYNAPYEKDGAEDWQRISRGGCNEEMRAVKETK